METSCDPTSPVNHDWHRDKGSASSDHTDDAGEKENCDKGAKLRSCHDAMISEGPWFVGRLAI